ncbi:MAG: mechanosensitive ion channel family protein [Myxococcota bacterium]
MSEQLREIQAMIVSMATDTLSVIVSFTPKLLGGLLVLFVGWLLARLVRAVVERSIRAGLDAVLERTGIAQTLERSAISTPPSAIVGQVLFWLIMIGFIMAASNILGMTAVAGAIARIFGYIPSVLSAALVLAAGVFLARFVGNVVSSGAEAANLSYAKGLGAVASMSITVMVGVVTLEQLGVDTQILITVITVTVAALVAGVSLAFALGARDVVRGILAGHYLRQNLPEGSPVEVAGERGVVEQVGPVSTVFRDGERSWSVPNTRLLDEVVRR